MASVQEVTAKRKAQRASASDSELQRIAQETGGRIITRDIGGRSVQAVEYKVKGNGFKITRYAYAGDQPDFSGPRINKRDTGQPGSPAYIPPATLTTANSSPASPINLPKPPAPSKTGTTALNSAMATAAGAAAAAATPAETSMDDEFQAYLKSLTAPESTEKIYDRTVREAELNQKKELVNNLTGQLNAITAQAEADKLKLVGQGRGITDTVIGGMQAQIDREAAIRALPISAQLAAAQADLAAAQDHVNTLFKIRVEDAQNKRDYRREIATAIWNYASEQQRSALARREKEEDRAFDMKLRNIEFARGLAETAIANGQPSLAARLMALDHDAANYEQQIANLSSGIYIAPKSSRASDSTIALSSDDRRTLLGSGLSADAISAIEADVNAYGLDAVLEDSGLSAAQKSALRKVYGSEGEPLLTREVVSQLLGLPDNGTRTGFLGLGKTTSQQLDAHMETIRIYREAGMSEKEIRDKLLKAVSS